MKLSSILFIVFVALGLMPSCEKQTLNTPIDEITGEAPIDFRGTREIPFIANFFTLRDYSEDGVGVCTEDPFTTFNYQVGEGTGTHLGACEVILHFCQNAFDYANGEGVFIAANGDELYYNIPSEGEIGHVIPFEDPHYELQFQDPFEFTGGTGRFEGASGQGYTNSFVDLFDDDGNFIPEHQTDHQWTGTLILP